MTRKETVLEQRKAEVLIKLRGYKLIKKQEDKDTISYLVRIPKEKVKALIWCILGETTVGINIMNNMQKAMKETGVERGIVVTNGKYTHSANQMARKKKIQLIPRDFPAFDLFKHELVPKHEILIKQEEDELLNRYKIHPYQLPQISSKDPAVIAIGAEPSNIVRITRRSLTAGKHVTFRYVVE